MDISGPSISGALRVGLQVISSHRRPLIECYYEVHNRMGPEQEYQVPKGARGDTTETLKTRSQDTFVDFRIVNIGGVRAENVQIKITGLNRFPPRDNLKELFAETIPQMAPSQAVYLFKIDVHDLYEYPEGGGKPLGLKRENLSITVQYDAPRSVLGFFKTLPQRIRGSKHYEMKFIFRTNMIETDFPPIEYV